MTKPYKERRTELMLTASGGLRLRRVAALWDGFDHAWMREHPRDYNLTTARDIRLLAADMGQRTTYCRTNVETKIRGDRPCRA